MVDHRPRLDRYRIWHNDRMEAYRRDDRWENRQIQDELLSGCILSTCHCRCYRDSIRTRTSCLHHAYHVVECSRNNGRRTWMEEWCWSTYDQAYSPRMGPHDADNDHSCCEYISRTQVGFYIGYFSLLFHSSFSLIRSYGWFFWYWVLEVVEEGDRNLGPSWYYISGKNESWPIWRSSQDYFSCIVWFEYVKVWIDRIYIIVIVN